MEDWFQSYVGPEAAVSVYAAAAPRGMTIGPQNPKVRAALLQDLAEYGIKLDYPRAWPPPVPTALRPRREESGLDSTLTRSRSSPLSSVGASYSSRGPHLKVTRRGAFGDVIDHNNYKGNRRATEAPAKRVWSSEPDAGSTDGALPYDRRLDATKQSSGCPTSFWRPVKVSLESCEGFPGAAAAKSKAQASTKHPGAGSDKMPRIPSDTELRNARDALKGQASLHSAAVSDRFRFAADMSAGAPLCIKGAGTAKCITAPNWASDASDLIQSHCGAMRTVNPSGMEMIKEPMVKQKKKKKKDDIDDLQLSESGLFQPKYPIDNSLKSLRRLKRNMFPDVVRKEQEEAARLKALMESAEEDLFKDRAAFAKELLFGGGQEKTVVEPAFS